VIQCPHCYWIIQDEAKPQDNLVKMRDSEVVLYRRSDSGRWQARFLTPDRKWHRISTKRIRIDDAKVVACEAYDRARFRAKEGLMPVSKRFREVARLTVQRMEEALAAGHGKSAFKDYKQAIDKYLIPFFGSTAIENIDIPKLQQFEVWRVEKMEKEPAASTVLNHNAALHRVFDTAISEGWIREQQLPTLRTVGKKSQRRPHFTSQEWNTLTEHLAHWPDKTPYPKSRLMRELMGDYALILANTGIRPGKEAMNLKWSALFHIERFFCIGKNLSSPANRFRCKGGSRAH